MALRDSITVHLDGSVPVKDRKLEVKATTPGGVVELDNGVGFIVISEKTRKGKVKTWRQANTEHVVSIVFEAG